MGCIDHSSAVEIRHFPVTMAPHAANRSHFPDDLIETLFDPHTGKGSCTPQFNKLAQQHHMPVGHAADMAAIFIDEGSHNGYRQIEKRQQITARGSERRLGNCKTAQAVDPVIQGPHASPVERQTARLNSH